MAVTIAIKKRATGEGRRVVLFDVTGPASYTSNGETLTAAQFGQLFPELGVPATADWTQVQFFESEVEPANGRSISLDKAGGKMLYWQAAATAGQVAAATNLSALVIRCRCEYHYGIV